MKTVLMALLALFAAGTTASAEIFDVPIPGVGPVRAIAGFAPSVNENGEPLSEFAGSVTLPFFVYAHIYGSENRPDAIVNSEFRMVTPSGRVFPEPFSGLWPAGSPGKGLVKEIRRLDEFGDYRFQFFFNGVEIARLTLTVTSRN